MKIQEILLKKIHGFYRDGRRKPTSLEKKLVDEILSLLSDAVREAIPEERKPYSVMLEGDKSKKELLKWTEQMNTAYQQALSDLRTNLIQRGILREEKQ